MAKVGSEVRIAGDADSMHAPLFDALAQADEFLRPVIQHRKVRTLGHQHHAIEAQVGRVIHKVVKTEDGLSPRSGVAHGMQQEAVDHIGDSVRPGLSLSRATDYDEILEPLNNQTLFRVANTGALGVCLLKHWTQQPRTRWNSHMAPSHSQPPPGKVTQLWCSNSPACLAVPISCYSKCPPR